MQWEIVAKKLSRSILYILASHNSPRLWWCRISFFSLFGGGRVSQKLFRLAEKGLFKTVSSSFWRNIPLVLQFVLILEHFTFSFVHCWRHWAFCFSRENRKELSTKQKPLRFLFSTSVLCLFPLAFPGISSLFSLPHQMHTNWRNSFLANSWRSTVYDHESSARKTLW